MELSDETQVEVVLPSAFTVVMHVPVTDWPEPVVSPGVTSARGCRGAADDGEVIASFPQAARTDAAAKARTNRAVFMGVPVLGGSA
jgi:hypothetical protein